MTPPLPIPDPDSAPFWRATLEGRLELQQCAACGRVVAYPRRRCPSCGSDALHWKLMSGRGTVHAFTVVHRPADPSFADRVPYVVALVDLAEGARVMTNIVGCPVDDVQIGLPVAVRFRTVSDVAALPEFAPSDRLGAHA